MTKKQIPHVVVSAIWTPAKHDTQGVVIEYAKPEELKAHWVMASDAKQATDKVERTFTGGRQSKLVRPNTIRYDDDAQKLADECFGYHDGIDNRPVLWPNSPAYVAGYSKGVRDQSIKDIFRGGEMWHDEADFAVVWKTAESPVHLDHQVTFFKTRDSMDAWVEQRRKLATAMKSSIEMFMFAWVKNEPIRIYN